MLLISILRSIVGVLLGYGLWNLCYAYDITGIALAFLIFISLVFYNFSAMWLEEFLVSYFNPENENVG